MILATDLDGTFLAGTDEAREKLIERFLNAPDAQLLYVTGRSAASVEELIDAGRLPRPHAMICDVGCDVISHADDPHAAETLDWIRARWHGKADPIREALARLPGLRPQERFGDNRLAYYYHDPAVLQPARDVVRQFDCDPLDSDGIFFDVLPRGVNKGSTLRRLMQARGVADEHVLVAGDTLNDLSMLTVGYPAVVVGGAEPALLERLPVHPRIHRAGAPGCDGIIEALNQFESEASFS